MSTPPRECPKVLPAARARENTGNGMNALTSNITAQAKIWWATPVTIPALSLSRAIAVGLAGNALFVALVVATSGR